MECSEISECPPYFCGLPARDNAWYNQKEILVSGSAKMHSCGGILSGISIVKPSCSGSLFSVLTCFPEKSMYLASVLQRDRSKAAFAYS
jgi:hypothetical protein